MLKSLAVASAVAALYVLFAQETAATPIYSIRSANRCTTCHIEPVGWHDPPEKKDRGCTLDCQACHVNRTGGGLRTPYGRYYADDTLPTFSLTARPSAFGNPEQYRKGGDPSSGGRYRLWEGFSGWQSGDVPVQEIHDRVGNINPNPKFLAGFDARFMGYADLEGDVAVFPMQADMHLWGKVSQHGAVYGTVGLQGRRARTVNDPNVGTDVTDLVTLRELVYEWDGVPYNGYVRAGRFFKPFGWRQPDHTIFTRAPLGLDQYGQVYGVEAGINPNYPFVNVATFYQGWSAFPGDRAPPGYGASATFGFRDLGWQLGGSTEALRLTEEGITATTFGPMWALNLYPVVYLGEAVMRIAQADQHTERSVHLYNEINYLIIQGVSAMVAHTWYQPELGGRLDALWRLIVGAQWDVLHNVQFAVQYRTSFARNDFAGHDFLFWTHLWY